MLARCCVVSLATVHGLSVRPLVTRASAPVLGLLDDLLGGGAKGFESPVVMGTEEMMSQKEFGTSAVSHAADQTLN